MSGAGLRAVGNRRWELRGDLDFETVPLIWRELAPLLKAPGTAVLSLARVEHANSAALALLLEARELAQSHGCELRVQGLSEGLRDIARISGVAQLIEGESH